MDWIKYELAVFARAGRDTWRALRPGSWGDALRGGIIVAVTIAALYIGGNAALAVEEITLQWAALYGLLAAIAGTFLFNLSLAPYRLHKTELSTHSFEFDKLTAKIGSLETRVRAYEEPRDTAEKLDIEEALKLLPSENRLELFRAGAYQDQFEVFGKKMESRIIRAGTTPIYVALNFDTGARLETDVGWPYFEDHVLVIDGPRDGEEVERGSVKPYIGIHDASGGNYFTDITVSKERFQIYAESCAETATS